MTLPGMMSDEVLGFLRQPNLPELRTPQRSCSTPCAGRSLTGHWRSFRRWHDSTRLPGATRAVVIASLVRADGRTLPLPARRPIKPIYIRMFLALVDGE